MWRPLQFRKVLSTEEEYERGREAFKAGELRPLNCRVAFFTGYQDALAEYIQEFRKAVR